MDSLSVSTLEPLFKDTTPGTPARKEDVEDTVMYTLDVRIIYLGSFIRPPTGYREIETACNIWQRELGKNDDLKALEVPQPGFLCGSGLLPSSENGSSFRPEASDNLLYMAKLLLSSILWSPGVDIEVAVRTVRWSRGVEYWHLAPI
ncbi:MAG: hypothetical protein M1813_000407 [Trichoglossum hirsutum]|nr:MAG: hypothetical protein M1813_000407 [Trichoglossum hirsutum]